MTFIKILDHGGISLVESWGSDDRIIKAARMSTNKGFLGWGPFWKCNLCGIELQGHNSHYGCPNEFDGNDWSEAKPGDEKLLKYLWENKHSTPFEMAGAVIEVQAPIFVFREWVRHRTQSYSEMSARYTPLPDVNYIPTVERLMLNSQTNKQAGTIKGAEQLTPEMAETYRQELADMYTKQESLYQQALSIGVPKELARVHLPVGRYSRMRASANLRNWLGFLTLRMAPGAQWEIREYANALHDILKPLFPRTVSLFDGDK